jgi:hypothetical protein
MEHPMEKFVNKNVLSNWRSTIDRVVALSDISSKFVDIKTHV